MSAYEMAVFDIEVTELTQQIERAIDVVVPQEASSACAVITALLGVLLKTVDRLPAYKRGPVDQLIFSEFSARGQVPRDRDLGGL